MTVGDERQQGMTVAAAADEFPVGMRVLAVDDDAICLKILEALLRHCKYHATIVRDGETALRLLRAGKEKYDLVISDVHMPGMDGFRLLKVINLEMDIPVIMLSANEEETSVMKGISTGACDYLVKPVKIKELKNIWQHVVRRRIPDPRVQPTEIAEGEWVAAKSTGKKKCSRRRMSGEDNADENKENKHLSTKKNPRVTWTSELHGRFLQAVNQIGIDRAVPKKILEIMNVSCITREAVASHLQKYRIYLKRVSGYTGRRSYPFADSFERWNSCHSMNEYGSSSSSGNLFPRMNSPSHFGAHSVQLPTQSFHLRNPQSSLGMRPVVPGGSMLNDARKLAPFGLRADSFINISDDTTLDDDEVEDGDDELPTCYRGNSYANILRNKLLEASKGIPSDSFEDMTSGATMSVPVNKLPVQSVAMSVPVNQFPVQSPQLGNQHPVPMNCTLTRTDSHFQDIVGNCSSRSWQTVVPTELPDLGHNGGASVSLDASRVNIHKINQLARVAASSGQIPVLQDQMAALISNPAPTAVHGEPTLPYDIEGNTSSMDMLDGNFAVGGASSINPALPDLEIDGFSVPTPMLNGEGAVGSLPVLKEGIVDQQYLVDQLDYSNQDPDGQINYNNDFLAGTDEPDMTATWDEFFANENFVQDDSFMDGDWI